MVPTRSMKAYMSRLLVLFLQLGQAAQHSEHAAEPQQHARPPKLSTPPIFTSSLFFFRALSQTENRDK